MRSPMRERTEHDPRGATVYVTLEPCNHTGTHAAVHRGAHRRGCRARRRRNGRPESGRGPRAERGCAKPASTVEVGLLEHDARELNAGFISRMTRGRPWVRMKVAASLDGRTALASGESQWITGEEARLDGHRFRARACAVLTGIGTVRQDDPRLTVRGVETPRQPLVVIVDRHGETPPVARALAGGNALVVTAGAPTRRGRRAWRRSRCPMPTAASTSRR